MNTEQVLLFTLTRHRTSPTFGNLSLRIILWPPGACVKTSWTPFASWYRFRTKDTRDLTSPQSPCGSKPYATTSSPTHQTKGRLRCSLCWSPQSSRNGSHSARKRVSSPYVEAPGASRAGISSGVVQSGVIDLLKRLPIESLLLRSSGETRSQRHSIPEVPSR